MTSAAPSSQEWLTPRAYSVPAIMPVATSEAGCPSSRNHPGGGGPPGRGASNEGAPPLPRAPRREPVAGAPDQVLVPRAGFVHHAQRHRYGRGLAARRAAVRFERVTEAAVVIAVGSHRVADRRGRPVLEQPLKAAPVEHPGVSGDERGRRAEFWSIHRPMTYSAAARA